MSTIKRLVVIALVLVGFQFIVAGQQLAFDAASIKENTSLNSGGTLRLMPGGGITAQGIPARQFIAMAYQLQGYQLVNAPDWSQTTKYDLIAKPAGPISREDNLKMLQTLLTERFHLAFHREEREVNGYALVRVRSDRLGPDLKVSDVDCSGPQTTAPKRRENHVDYQPTSTSLIMNGTPMWSLLQIAIGQMAAPVTDETGLSGTLDIALRWSRDIANTDDLRPFDVAIQDQLGLKLELRRVKTEVFVVDRPAPKGFGARTGVFSKEIGVLHGLHRTM